MRLKPLLAPERVHRHTGGLEIIDGNPTLPNIVHRHTGGLESIP